MVLEGRLCSNMVLGEVVIYARKVVRKVHRILEGNSLSLNLCIVGLYLGLNGVVLGFWKEIIFEFNALKTYTQALLVCTFVLYENITCNWGFDINVNV